MPYSKPTIKGLCVQIIIIKKIIIAYLHWAILGLAIVIGILKGYLLFHLGSAQDEDYGKGLGVFVIVSSPASSPAKDSSSLF